LVRGKAVPGPALLGAAGSRVGVCVKPCRLVFQQLLLLHLEALILLLCDLHVSSLVEPSKAGALNNTSATDASSSWCGGRLHPHMSLLRNILLKR